jgi:serine kinase of HPr protein (carbohydrate metabolism regulator)
LYQGIDPFVRLKRKEGRRERMANDEEKKRVSRTPVAPTNVPIAPIQNASPIPIPFG